MSLGENAATHAIALSRDGSLLASVRDADGALLLWRLPATQTGQFPAGVRVTDVAISPDGARIAIGEAGAVSLWDARTMERIARQRYGQPPQTPATGKDGPKGEAEPQRAPSTTALAFSVDGRLLAAGGTDARLRLWDATTLEPVRTFTATLQSVVTSIAFSPDGSLLASSSEDGTARLWRVSDGAELRTLAHAGTWRDSLSPNAVWGVAFNSAGTLLATACADRKVRIWGIPTEPVR